jgi:hypothetical protein
LQQATTAKATLDQVSLGVDRDVTIASRRAITNRYTRDNIANQRSEIDYRSQTEQGNFYSTKQNDEERYRAGKLELGMDFEEGAISAETYRQRLRALTLETDTLRNAMLPLRQASNDFFDDIFKGKDIFAGLTDAVRNFAVSTLSQIQSMISQHLGQQLFKSLTAGGRDAANDTSEAAPYSVTKILQSGLKFLGLGDNRDYGNPAKLNEGPNLSDLKSLGHEYVGSRVAGSKTGDSKLKQSGGGGLFGGDPVVSGLLNLGFSLLGFADGGVVTKPTMALIGEGANNEAVVPLPNGRSIPVEMKGANTNSSGPAINSSVSVTLNNNGQAQEVSRNAANNITASIKSAVLDVLIDESRPGGLLSGG